MGERHLLCWPVASEAHAPLPGAGWATNRARGWLPTLRSACLILIPGYLFAL
jgi:hypothetical protein